MDSKRSNDAEHLGECSKFTIGGFYGNDRCSTTASRMQETILQVEKRTKIMEERPLPRTYNPGLLGPPSIWQTFARQAEAIKYCQLQGQGLMVFSYEGDALGGNGKRRYLVTHPRLMWIRLLDRNPRQRCAYELIQEHSVCKLYFDLEFLYEHNTHKDGNNMVNTFIQIVCHFIFEQFGIKCARENIIDLSSSSTVKFSRHLIFILPNAAFATNIHVGNFVIMICNKIRDWRNDPSIEVSGITQNDVCDLFIKSGEEKDEVLFCDEGVYTKNRNFRTLHATKLGKNTALVVSKENQYRPVVKNGISIDEQFFLDSLVTTVEERCNILTYGEDSSKVHRLPCASRAEKTGFEGCNDSPYPEIDSHIKSVVQPGYIRCWFYFSQTEQIVYEIAQNRYCYNVGREHKSNGVMYIVNLKTGCFYQKCHDQDCRGFKSQTWPLPEGALFWKNLQEEEMIAVAHSVAGDFGETDSEDEMLVSAVAQVELEEMAHKGEEQLSRSKTMELWNNLDALSSFDSSLPGSQHSNISLSQTSNPWDKLSQLSTPDSSFFTNWSELPTSSNELSQPEAKDPSKLESNCIAESGNNTMEIDSDEEFAREAARVEREFFGKKSNISDAEIEFHSCRV